MDIKDKTPIETLQDHLKANPGIQKVYFNKSGEWFFHENKKFPIEKSADEVMKSGFAISNKEAKAASDLGDQTGADPKTATEAMQEDEASKEIIPIKDKLNGGGDNHSADAFDVNTTEITGTNQVIVDQPVIPDDAIPDSPKNKNKAK